jgi:hypothetical protein
MMTQGRESTGRYTRVHDAQHPGPELPRARAHMRVRVAAVPDPMPLIDSKRPTRQKVAINIHTDALETEYSYGRISEAAYCAGRAYQYVLEVSRGRTSGGCSFEPKDRCNPATAHEWAIISGLENAQAAVDLIYETRSAVGQWAECLLSDILGAGITIGQAALARGYTSTHGRRKIAAEFREALEGLAKSFDGAV